VAGGLLAVAFACGAYLYLSLPDVRPLRTGNPEATAFQRLRADEARRKGQTPRRIQKWVDYGRISPNLTRAVLVAEDAKFWQHEGVDLEQLRESMELNIERLEFSRGGSTITQQLAKNLYLSPSKNPVRKARELLIARRLEAELSKRRILELYLNVIEWGDGIYGAEAAAQSYFRKPASNLSPQESALMAAAIVNPRLFDIARPSTGLRRRQQMIARRMGAVLPPAAAGPPAPKPESIRSVPLEPVPSLPETGPAPHLPGQVVPASPTSPCADPPCR
jgi:monofunctional biosynthetic peptidoglycan transglycosylase